MRDSTQHNPDEQARVLEPERKGTPHQRRLRRIPLYRNMLPLLAAVVLLCTAGLVSIAYLAARSEAINVAQTTAQHAVAVERAILAERGGPIELRDSQLVIPSDPNPAYTLNNDLAMVDRTQALTGTFLTIYELEGRRLVAVSTNVPTFSQGHIVAGSRALGDVLPGSVNTTLGSACAVSAPASCHQPYAGTVAIRGSTYVVTIEPLYTSSGTFIGALGAALPLDSVLAPVVQLTVLLVLVGLFVALIAIVVGSWLLSRISERMLGSLDDGLQGVAGIAAELEHTVHRQVTRAQRQAQIARNVLDQARTLDGMASDIRQEQSALRSSTGELWAEVSHPGALPDTELTMHLARETAVAAARTGTRVGDVQILSRRLIALLNHVIAESHLISTGGRDVVQRSRELRETIESIEMTLGERLVHRMGLLSVPLLLRGGWRRRQSAREAPEQDDISATSPTSSVIIPGAGKSGARRHHRTGGGQGRTSYFTSHPLPHPETSGSRRIPPGMRWNRPPDRQGQPEQDNQDADEES